MANGKIDQALWSLGLFFLTQSHLERSSKRIEPIHRMLWSKSPFHIQVPLETSRYIQFPWSKKHAKIWPIGPSTTQLVKPLSWGQGVDVSFWSQETRCFSLAPETIHQKDSKAYTTTTQNQPALLYSIRHKLSYSVPFCGLNLPTPKIFQPLAFSDDLARHCCVEVIKIRLFGDVLEVVEASLEHKTCARSRGLVWRLW